MHSLFNCDDSLTNDIRAIREALGAISAAEPMVCWVHPGEDGEWLVRHEGDPDERTFPSRERALAAAQFSVVRSASYCLYVQDEDGRVTRSSRTGCPGATYRSLS